MVKSAVRVAIRTRPTDRPASEIEIGSDKKTISIRLKPNEKAGAVNNAQNSYTFKYDTVLYNTSQEAVFEDCAREIVNSVLEGYNGTIMAYGQTGAGKTYTMTGGANYKYRGMAPRAISEIFKYVQNRSDSAVTVRLSYVEIYNEQLFDLLAPVPAADQQELQIVDDAKGSVMVKGLTRPVATSEEEALNLLFEGDTNRAIGEHQLNKSSTRSHCILTIYVETRSRVDASERVVVSKLNLVDLAGSERIKKTGSEGIIMKEANYINKSLTFLEQVVIALADKSREHVPYRQSKLTSVLKDSLGGNCKTLMIANVWPEGAFLEETVATLKFAARMSRVRNEASVNEQQDPLLLIRRYEREIKELKQELAMHDSMANRGRVQYEAYTEEQQHEMQTLVRRYLAGEVEEIEVVNLRQIREIFRAFKAIAGNAVAEAEERVRSQLAASGSGQLHGDRRASAAADGRRTPAGGAEDGVGDADGGRGISVGMAPSNARPGAQGKAPIKTAPKPGAPGAAPPSPAPQEMPAVPEEAGPEGAEKPEKPKGPPPSRNVAFESFKADQGAEYSAALVENKAALKDKKKAVRELGETINGTKAKIDDLKDRVSAKKAQRTAAAAAGGGASDEEEVIDEEEYAYIKQMKDLKKTYQAAYEEYKVARQDVQYLSRLVEQCQEKLVLEFQSWYESTYGTAPGEEAGGAGEAAGEAAGGTGALKAGKDEEEPLDYGEEFERMKAERIMQADPESVAFYNARKAAAKPRAGAGASPSKRRPAAPAAPVRR